MGCGAIESQQKHTNTRAKLERVFVLKKLLFLNRKNCLIILRFKNG